MTFCETANLDRLQTTTPTLPVVFLPGWGFDGRITELIGPEAREWISPASMLDPASLVSDLTAFLDAAGIEQIKLIGWSMGANLALDFARIHPDRVAALDLVAMRRSWPANEIEAIAADLKADPARFLITFFRKCFLGHKTAYGHFVKSLQNDYIRQVDTEFLEKGLAYLRRARVIPAPGIPTRLVHGRNDIIAPLDQRADLPGVTVELIEHCGHLPFLLPAFFQRDRERKEAICRRFSRAAATYDEHARLQMELAEELGNARLSNMIMIGALLELTHVLPPDVVKKALEEHIAERHKKTIPSNYKAMEKGASFAREAMAEKA